MSRRKTLNSSVKVFHLKKKKLLFFDGMLMKTPKEISLNIKVHLKKKISWIICFKGPCIIKYMTCFPC